MAYTDRIFVRRVFVMTTHRVIIIIVLLSRQKVFGHRGAGTVCHKVSPLTTTASGAPVDNELNSLSAGLVGPLLLQDSALVETLAHFNRERIPPRTTHAKGAGAFGHFTVTDGSFAKHCSASVFAPGKKTTVAARFSNFAQERGSCDTVRGLQGAAVKFYTDDGNFDLVGHNSPVFFVRDPMLYPSLVHAMKRHPASNLPNATAFWDFMSRRPETSHQLLFAFSDRGLPDGFARMNVHAANTFRVSNATRHAAYCKFHFKADLGVKNLNDSRARQLCGSDPDYYGRSLYDSIGRGDFPSWTMCYQIMSFSEAAAFKWNPFDATKVWPQSQFPLHEIGRLVLDRNPADHFADVEQAAFSPANLVPGIEPSPDRVLQGRLFAYSDAQRHRLGANYNQLPVNSPFKIAVSNRQRDGAMRFGTNQAGSPNYWPNGEPKSAQPCLAATPSAWRLPAGTVARYNSDNQDNFEQSTTFWSEILNEDQKKRLVASMGDHLKQASKGVQKKVVEQFKNVGEDLAERLAAAIGLDQ